MKIISDKNGVDDPVKDTVGKLSRDLSMQDDLKINPIDLQRAIHKGHNSEDSFEHQLLTCLERGKNAIDGPFFIVVLAKKERVMHNVVRQYFLFRHTCPTPEYDQTVYRFDPKDEHLEYLWTVPDKETTTGLAMMGNSVEPEYRQLAKFCSDFMLGNLDRKCARLNGEEWRG